MIQKKYRVFVYGTLMNGARNAHLLSNSTLINPNAITAEASFLMQQFNSATSKGKHTPGVLKNGDKHIEGEIWEVDEETLARLDELEGYNPNLSLNKNKYLREEIKMKNGSTAWIYIINTKENQPIPLPHDRILYDKDTNTLSRVREEPRLTP